MKIACPHCSTVIEIDADTLAAYAGHTRFACPACQGLVEMPASARARVKVPKATPANTHRGINRNLLILGSATLLVLGGIGFLLASLKSGDTNTVNQNIRNEIINNSYFQNLIATGLTTRKDLEAIAQIRPYGDGFIGVSSEPLTWEKANGLAWRTGSTILTSKQEGSAQTSILFKWLKDTFPQETSSSLWMEKEREAGVFTGQELLGVNQAAGIRKVLLEWSPAESRGDGIIASATRGRPFENGLGMRFVPVPITPDIRSPHGRPVPDASDLILRPAVWRLREEPNYFCQIKDLATRPDLYPRWLPGPVGTRIELQFNLATATTVLARLGKATPSSRVSLLLDGKEVGGLSVTEAMFKGPASRGVGGEHLGPINEDLWLTVPAGDHKVEFINSGAGWIEFPSIRIATKRTKGSQANRDTLLFCVWEIRVTDYAAYITEAGHAWTKAEIAQGPDHPAVNISWEDAEKFCLWLTERERNSGLIGKDLSYRLPTDHEWSCAVGIGNREDAASRPIEKQAKIPNVYPWGSDWPLASPVGNFAGDEMSSAAALGKYGQLKDSIDGYNDGFIETAPVGSFAANQYGLFDLGGNVWEWCDDWFDGENQGQRVLRGASWADTATWGGHPGALLSSFRARHTPNIRYPFNGFRLVLGPDTGESKAPADLKSLGDPPNTSRRAIDLMPLVDLSRDSLPDGAWSKTQEGISAADAEKSRPWIQFPHRIATDEYDYEIEFIYHSVNHEHRIGFPVPGHRVEWAMNVFPERQVPYYFFVDLDGIPAARAKEAVARLYQLKTGSRHTHMVKVRDGEIAAFLDGTQVVHWKGDLRRFNRPSRFIRDPRFPDFFAHGSGIVIHKARIIEFLPN